MPHLLISFTYACEQSTGTVCTTIATYMHYVHCCTVHNNICITRILGTACVDDKCVLNLNVKRYGIWSEYATW